MALGDLTRFARATCPEHFALLRRYGRYFLSDLFDRASARIHVVENILDVGAGIRPQSFFKARSHLCVEPHGEYADWLEAEGYPVLRTTAKYALGLIGRVDTIFLLDVIEHMLKPEGLDVLKLAKTKAKRQIVVFTPLGFYRQSYNSPGAKDAWGLNGTHWQTHRSGWKPEDFPGWTIIEDPAFHNGSGAFFAIFNA